MPGWTTDELARIGTADELEVASYRTDRSCSGTRRFGSFALATICTYGLIAAKQPHMRPTGLCRFCVISTERPRTAGQKLKRKNSRQRLLGVPPMLR
jgi:hypothetical protein